MNKRSILKKTAQVGSMTMLSRFLGIVRETLLMSFLGIGGTSDAFLVAWGLPNHFRKIFAEGALSAAFVPVFVKLVRSGKREVANSLMTLSFLFFEGILFFICLFVVFWPQLVVETMAPGFSAEQIAYTVPLLRILFPFIFFISSGALLAGALQSVNHFFIPAFAQPLNNVFWISFLIIGLYQGYSTEFLCAGILLGGATQLVLHIIMFFYKGFKFAGVTAAAVESFRHVLTKFVPCLLGASIMEANLFIDKYIGSFLPKGSLTILYYGNRFMQIPLGIFAIALSTTLLPHFSRIVLYAPKRINFYLLEVAKFVSWAIIPTMFFLTFNAEKIFYIFLMGKKGSVEHVPVAKVILMIYVTGLLFFCINKVFTSIFFAFRDTWSPSIGFAISAGVNIAGNIIGMYFFGIYGIAISTVLSGISLSLFFFYTLRKWHHVDFYLYRYFSFLTRYLIHLLVALAVFLLLHYTVFSYVQMLNVAYFFTWQWGYWFIEVPLFVIAMLAMFYTRKLFNSDVYFLDA